MWTDLCIYYSKAAADDIIPLGTPIKTVDGQLVDRISIVKGQAIAIPMQTINKSKSIWGLDAHDFKPQRWLDEGGVPETVKVVQGYRHLLTFVDGPRTCLGKGFALAEFKVLSLAIFYPNQLSLLTRLTLGCFVNPRTELHVWAEGWSGYEVRNGKKCFAST